jgi:hypothetical protein
MSEPSFSGVWEHRSGGRYLVLGLGRLDEDDDDVVVYVRLYGRDEGGAPMSVRRRTSFLEPVMWPDGQTRPRFMRLGDAEPRQGG